MKTFRSVKAPDLFIEQYQVIFLVMSIIQSDILQGKGIDGNCYSVARALAKKFTSFRVADGYVPRIVPFNFEEKFGARAVLLVEGVNPQPVRVQMLYHSWLVWKDDQKFIIDPWPLGGMYGCSPPIAHAQDEFDIIYNETKLTDVFDEKDVAQNAESFYPRIVSVLQEFSRAYDGSRQKAPA